MVLALQIILAVCFAGTGIMLAADIKKNHKGELKGNSKQWGINMGISVLCNFLDTLGCGSFAPSTFLYRTTGTVDDINIPGTLNVGNCFPVIFQALIFTTTVECEPLFLILMCVAAAIGAYTMAEVVCKWDVNRIRLWMALVMIPCAAVMAMKASGIGPFGALGTATGLTGWQLIVAVALNFVWGALMDIGFGLYAPCMATCLMLGCSATVCFPVFMSSCALLMPANSIVFIKRSRYDVIATVCNVLGGCVGVFIAWKIITNIPLKAIVYIVCVVLLWTSYTMLRDRAKSLKAQQA